MPRPHKKKASQCLIYRIVKHTTRICGSYLYCPRRGFLGVSEAKTKLSQFSGKVALFQPQSFGGSADAALMQLELFF